MHQLPHRKLFKLYLSSTRQNQLHNNHSRHLFNIWINIFFGFIELISIFDQILHNFVDAKVENLPGITNSQENLKISLYPPKVSKTVPERHLRFSNSIMATSFFLSFAYYDAKKTLINVVIHFTKRSLPFLGRP